jgi:hypothetical protein
MRIATATLESLSPYQQGKYIETPRLRNKAGNVTETSDDHEKRTWRDRCHSNEQGYVIIPPNVWKNSLSDTAKFLSKPIPGKGKSTYTKHFMSGILVVDALVLPIKKEDVDGVWLFLPSDGRPGGSTRVKKCFPTIPHWSGDVRYYILDETITEEVFHQHLVDCGNFIGIGVFRPRANGYQGRFRVKDIQWSNPDSL